MKRACNPGPALLAAAVLSLPACDRTDPEPVPVPPIPQPTAVPTLSSVQPALEKVALTPASPSLTPEGLGPVRIGMTETEARAVLHQPSDDAAEDRGDPAACHLLWSGSSQSDIVYMIEDGRVSRITLRSPAVRTDRGLGVGATEAEVRRAYGAELIVEPHKYSDAPASYLLAWAEPERRGFVFETDRGRIVREIHAGTPSIRYVEGCL